MKCLITLDVAFQLRMAHAEGSGGKLVKQGRIETGIVTVSLLHDSICPAFTYFHPKSA